MGVYQGQKTAAAIAKTGTLGRPKPPPTVVA
jgi:hypothetical protein